MGELVQLHTGTVSPAVVVAVYALERALLAAVHEAQAANVPQGLIVGLLHAHTTQQTQRMLDGA